LGDRDAAERVRGRVERPVGGGERPGGGVVVLGLEAAAVGAGARVDVQLQRGGGDGRPGGQPGGVEPQQRHVDAVVREREPAAGGHRLAVPDGGGAGRRVAGRLGAGDVDLAVVAAGGERHRQRPRRALRGHRGGLGGGGGGVAGAVGGGDGDLDLGADVGGGQRIGVLVGADVR